MRSTESSGSWEPDRNADC